MTFQALIKAFERCHSHVLRAVFLITASGRYPRTVFQLHCSTREAHALNKLFFSHQPWSEGIYVSFVLVCLVTVLAVIVSWSFPVEGKASGTDSESSHLRGLSVSQSAEAKQRKTLCLHGMIKPPFNVLFTFWGFYQLVRKRTGAKCEKAEFWILIFFFFSSQFWFFFLHIILRKKVFSEKKKSEFIFNFFLRILNFFTEFWKKKY